MRIAVGGIEHEASSFIPEPTPLAAFNNLSRSGDEISRMGDANDIVDGLVRGVRDAGMDLVPLYWAFANSGGMCTRETFEVLKERLIKPLRDAVPVDGVLLSLHGAFSVQGVDDADGDILATVRELVGPSCPIIAVNDFHSNISSAMVQAADALIIERTYPHTDMAERGLDAAQLMASTVRGEVRPTMAFRPLPLFWSASRMITADHPMKSAIDELDRILAVPKVLTASISVGYQWADSPVVGASTVVVTDNDPLLATELADSYARWIWDRRDTWQRESLSPSKALEMGEAAGRYPIILADQADNPGGGAPGDSTEVLRLFVEKDLQDAAVLYVVDRQSVADARQAGVGATVHLKAGGKSHPLLGPPVDLTAEVIALSDGHFVYDGPMYAGRDEYLGDSALVRQGGLYVIFISEMCQPMDLAFPRSLGLDCRRLRYICVKSTGHFRSGFGPIAGSIFNVDAQGLLTQDFKRLPFKRLGRDVYPMQPLAEVDWSVPTKPCLARR